MKMRDGLLRFFACCLLLLFPALGFSTEEYAEQTGKSCEACHVSPSGGLPLTPEGLAFKASLDQTGEYKPLSPFQRILRVIVGFIHLGTAIFWFGTIIYVHFILKPAYASRGLPKGELRIGVASIPVMAVTGTILAAMRLSSWDMLLHSRFGLLLSLKIFLFLLMTTSAAIVIFAIGPRMRQKRAASLGEKQDLTVDDLAQFDGKEGRAAYIGYQGQVYDVSKSKLWPNGIHARKHRAGFDLTDLLSQAPHGEEKVASMPLVVALKEQKREVRRPFYERAFFFLAYLNLCFVFLIIFIISLWRW